jgi:hypothetical protein
MASPPSSNWRPNDRLSFRDCYGSNRKEGVVTGFAGPYSVIVRVGRTEFTVPTSLIVDPFDDV